jgi:hypothetical protein
MSEPLGEEDGWNPADLGEVDVVQVLEFIQSLRVAVDAEERRLLDQAGPFEAQSEEKPGEDPG